MKAILEGARGRISRGWHEPFSLDAQGRMATERSIVARWCLADAVEDAAQYHPERACEALELLEATCCPALALFDKAVRTYLAAKRDADGLAALKLARRPGVVDVGGLASWLEAGDRTRDDVVALLNRAMQRARRTG